MQIKTVSDFRAAIRNGAYTDLGGYPVFFVTMDGGVLSYAAAKANKRNVIDSIANNYNDGWWIAGLDVNWEDAQLHCDHTGKRIESAYGDEDALSD